METSYKNPLVSVIIPTYNSSRTIENTLKSIINQSYDNIEIIVVDNNSRDNTKNIASQYTKNVFNKGPERTAQKNYGIELANGEYFLIIDGDMSIDRELISDCIIQIQKSEKGAGVCIPVVDTGKSFWTKVIAFERSFYKGTNIEAARFLKGDLVKKIGGYKDIIFYEEFIVPQEIAQLGYDVKIHTDYNLYHDYNDFNFLSNLSKKFYYGKSLCEYKKKIKEIGICETGSNQLGIFNRYMIFFKNKKFYSKPLLAFGVLVLKTLEFGSGALGLIYSKTK